jgi:methylaspartate ammonia-lyase
LGAKAQTKGVPSYTIIDVLAVAATGGFFADDQAAIKAGAVRDGADYRGAALTEGFDAVRPPAGAVSVLLILSDGYIAHGDCVGVQYSGVGGRERRLQPDRLAAVIAEQVAPRLRGLDLDGFRATSDLIDGLVHDVDWFGAAGAYGLSQALLDAAAHAAKTTMAQLIHDEWDVRDPLHAVPVFAQTGEHRHSNVDKMILKGVDSLPHGLINDSPLVGPGGRALIDYVRWVRERVIHLRRSLDYAPVLHFDVYGLIGTVCGDDLAQIAAVIDAVARAARPFAVRVEHPLDAGSRDAQIRELTLLRTALDQEGVRAEIVADEWANTVADIHAFNRVGAAHMVQIKTPDLGAIQHSVDAVLDCHEHGVVAHIGGSCCETDRSAQVSVHLALGSGADQLLAKPGMGVDEGLSIVCNEMRRTLALSQLTTLKAGS